MAWTIQQQNAIDARDSSIIVSAAAGSGKTAVLSERLVQLLSDPSSGVRADRIVVVTFTNDAAAELKKRLDIKLRDLINERPADQYLLKQQTLLQNAKISTINSFCFDLLRDNITEQGITSGFTILEETDNNVILSQAMEDLLDWYSSNDYDTISFLYDKFCLNDYTPLTAIISETDRFLSSVALADKWLDRAVDEYKKNFRDSIYYERIFEKITDSSLRAVQLAEQNYAALNDIFPEPSSDFVEESYIFTDFDLQRAEKLLELGNKRIYPSEEDIAFITGFERLRRIPSSIQYNSAQWELYKSRRDEFKNILKNTVGILGTLENDFVETAEVVEKLADVVRKYRQLVWERKCSRNAVSFDDGERLALELLADTDEDGRIVQSETAKRTAEYYDIIMIDEYQDSSNKEDLIFKLLTKNFRYSSSGTPMYGDNAFLVGDVKQSIYRFRLANPKNFITTMNNSDPFESNSKNRYILLNRNFRSSPEVIDFVNYIFGEIMSRECGDIDYNDDEKLYFGAEAYANPDCERLTAINFINTDPIDTDDVDSVSESSEAEITASQIADMLNKKYAVIESKDKSRPCKPKDFCILVRNNGFTKAYVKALEKRGIPAKGSDEKGYLKSQEIAILIDLLRIIANPLLDVPLAAVMVSPMFMFSISELAYIKTYDTRSALYPLIISAAKGKLVGFDLSLAARCSSFLEIVDRFRLDSVTMTVGELIASIYDTTDFISVMQQQSDGERKRANLRILIRYAQNYETSAAAEGSGGLTGFIRHIDRILENGDYEQGKSSAFSGDYVTVQTLHRSKGLEYPFVYIAETSVNFKSDSKSVMCSDDGRIGFTLYDKSLMRRYKTFQQKMLKSESENDSRSEEMRLFYVGMTRARQKLFINISCGKNQLKKVGNLVESCVVANSSITELVKNAKCFSDWLWLSLMMHGSFPEIAEQVGLETTSLGFPAHDTDEKLFQYRICRAEDDEYHISASDSPALPDEDTVQRINSMIRAKYDDSLTNVTAKLSVTQITRKFRDDEEFDLRLARPNFISSNSPLSGAERGTAIHTFFQYCDFEKAAIDPESEVDRLAELGFLDRDQKECIDSKKIRAFFRSELYMRISQAKSCQREKKFMVSAAHLKLDEPLFEQISRSDGMIKGIIDLVYETENGLVIVDYKSDRGLTAEELKERYTKQLMIYKSAVELTTEKPVIGLSLYSIELEQEIVIE